MVEGRGACGPILDPNLGAVGHDLLRHARRPATPSCIETCEQRQHARERSRKWTIAGPVLFASFRPVDGRTGPNVSRMGEGKMPREMEPEQFVERYRDLIGQLETTLSDAHRVEIQQAARQLRERWREWQGEDSLHDMAFGEP